MGRHRQNITHAPPPAINYRIDLVCVDFGTEQSTVAESAYRATDLRRYEHPDPGRVKMAIRLAKELDTDDPGWRIPEYPSSPVYMREQRINIVGAVWKFCDRYPPEDVFSVTLIPAGLIYPAGQLDRANAIDIMETMRTRLNQAKKQVKIKKPRGFMFIGLHGEFDAGVGAFRLHFHGIGAGSDWRKIIDALRKQKAFKSRRSGDGKGKMGKRSDKPVRMSRKPLKSLPASISYTIQSFWPGRWTGVDKLGKPIKSHGRRRIKPPHHSEYLLWLSQWQLSDLILMINLRMTKRGLTIRD